MTNFKHWLWEEVFHFVGKSKQLKWFNFLQFCILVKLLLIIFPCAFSMGWGVSLCKWTYSGVGFSLSLDHFFNFHSCIQTLCLSLPETCFQTFVRACNLVAIFCCYRYLHVCSIFLTHIILLCSSVPYHVLFFFQGILLFSPLQMKEIFRQ